MRSQDTVWRKIRRIMYIIYPDIYVWVSMTGNCPISSYRENSTRHVSYFHWRRSGLVIKSPKWKIRVIGYGQPCIEKNLVFITLWCTRIRGLVSILADVYCLRLTTYLPLRSHLSSQSSCILIKTITCLNSCRLMDTLYLELLQIQITNPKSALWKGRDWNAGNFHNRATKEVKTKPECPCRANQASLRLGNRDQWDQLQVKLSVTGLSHVTQSGSKHDHLKVLILHGLVF